jgi:hypothetical protein
VAPSSIVSVTKSFLATLLGGAGGADDRRSAGVGALSGYSAYSLTALFTVMIIFPLLIELDFPLLNAGDISRGISNSSFIVFSTHGQHHNQLIS